MKKLVIFRTDKELVKTILCLYNIETEYKFSLRKMWNLFCALNDKLLKHQGSIVHFRGKKKKKLKEPWSHGGKNEQTYCKDREERGTRLKMRAFVGPW